MLAQTNAPRIGYVYPAGGQVGTTVLVKVAGQYLEGVDWVLFTGDGLEARVIEYTRPLNAKQAEQLREQLMALQKAPQDPNTRAQIAHIRQLLATVRPPNPAIAEIITLEVRIRPDSTPGVRQLRCSGRRGPTNPVNFLVGRLPEYNEPPSTLPQARQPARSGPPVEVAIPVVINGQILPGQVDRYVFRAQQGQVIVAAVAARSLIPYLADAVPGWFQARLSLFDPSGKEVAYCDDWRFDPDPVICYEVRQDGQYTIELADALYRGREDFVYRLTIGQLPYLTGIYPLGGSSGRSTQIRLAGWNLPIQEICVDGAKMEPGLYELPLPGQMECINRMPFMVDRMEAIAEQAAREVRFGPGARTAPVVVDGSIDKPCQVDVFAIDWPGGAMVAEVYARRLASPLDAVLRVLDQDGKEVGFCDDHNDIRFALLTHQADPYLLLNLPGSRRYQVHLADATGKAGADHVYRLRVGPAMPDFDIIAWPSAVTVRAGGSVVLNLQVVRMDGFSGPIQVLLEGSDKGFSIQGGLIPAGCDSLRVTLTANTDVNEGCHQLAMVAQGNVGDHLIRKRVRPADRMMQAFAYEHLVPAQQLLAFVWGRWPAGLLRIASPLPVQIPAGGTASVILNGARPIAMGRWRLELDDPPKGIGLKEVVARPAGVELVFQADKQSDGPYAGNLILQVLNNPPEGQQAASRPAVGNLGVIPAIPFRLVR